VFQVDDGPRYEASGRWAHEPERSTWTSAETRRPLPRREADRASEYDVLVGVNRHVITPEGWEHAQDNRKRVLRSGDSLARERGLNRYARIASPASAVAAAYLNDTGEFWRDVRSVWDELLRETRTFVLRDEVAGAALYERLFHLSRADAATSDARR
jgi:hypothetical protein